MALENREMRQYAQDEYARILTISASPSQENNFGADRYNASEMRVVELVEPLPYVDSVVRVPQYSEDDQRGCDIHVTFKNGIAPVEIQVKSSREGIRRLRRNYTEDYGVRGDETDDRWAAERRIVINAGIKDNRELVTGQEILESFYRGLKRIEHPRHIRQVYPEAG